VSHVYCPECGFQNPEAANYCSKCGTLLVADEAGAETTLVYAIEPGEEEPAEALDAESVSGPTLVVRAGGGRVGETFHPAGERTTVGRSPDCEIFLDDVTVSRKHAAVTRNGDAFTVDDLGSLNGTFLNRRRIDSAPLEDGDELQIGKYRLTFLIR
jgi:FHA domain/zinc-ribbon domain